MRRRPRTSSLPPCDTSGTTVARTGTGRYVCRTQLVAAFSMRSRRWSLCVPTFLDCEVRLLETEPPAQGAGRNARFVSGWPREPSHVGAGVARPVRGRARRRRLGGRRRGRRRRLRRRRRREGCHRESDDRSDRCQRRGHQQKELPVPGHMHLRTFKAPSERGALISQGWSASLRTPPGCPVNSVREAPPPWEATMAPEPGRRSV
jgi:hypothetical protein